MKGCTFKRMVKDGWKNGWKDGLYDLESDEMSW